MAQGRHLGAAALSQPQTGSDLSSIAYRARRDGDEWVITGNKYWCTFADGAGYTTLHPIERYWRDARLTNTFEGASETQQRIISDQLLGKLTPN